MKEKYADIIVDISHEKVDRPFQYRIPPKFEDQLEIGMCVIVPFGNGNKLIRGYVIEIGEECKFAPDRIKNICGIEKEGACVESRLIRLAVWIRRNYGSTMIQALKTVLPAKQSVKRLAHKTIQRCMSKEETISLLGECERKKQTAKARLLGQLLTQEELPYEWITGKLGVSGITVRNLEKAGVVRIISEDYYRNPVKARDETDTPRILSQGQQQIVTEVIRDFDDNNYGTYLIHGITGSGKTEVYMKLIEEIVGRGRQAIVLIPEIALTYQTLIRFYSRFGDRVSVMNSTLSPGEKYDQCERAKNGEIDIIIGPRSALFTPFPQIGLIIMDEEHENSYKSESTPKYHARETAEEVARLHGASVVLGSATPSLEAYYRASIGEYKLFRLNERLTGGMLPKVYTVDLRAELKEGNRSIFSRKLYESLEECLMRGEQSMLFINRRGYAGFISCRACGHVMKCPHCDVSLSEHKNGQLICHYCGYAEPKVSKCPVCGSRYISGFRAGTQQIEEKLKELLPQARILRMDADTTRKKNSYEKILSSFANGEADILLGTQMIVKGHDFPNVTLVGVLAADLSLAVSDYRAGERTFQLLTQAAGRAGRGQKPGTVIIQTYQPEHYAVVHAAEQNYEAFYSEEILYREIMSYPPAANMLAVQIFAKTEEAGSALAGNLALAARKQAGSIKNGREFMTVIGPAPASITKINDIFRFVFYVKYSDYGKLVFIKDKMEGIIQDMQLKQENVQFDFNPVNMM